MLPEIERERVLKERDKLCFACPASYPASYSSCPRCQLPLVFPIIGRTWAIEGLIGRGGMGAVFAAHHISAPQRKAAVKVLVPVPGEQMADRRDRIGRFHREALALRRLVHENIVQLYDFARERDGSLYLAMERLDGPTLSMILRQGGPLPYRRAVELILPVLSAVGAAHKVGVIHRDLKPDNIVLAQIVKDGARRQVVKVVDFGVARLAGDTFTRTGQALGTPVYMPPEQANGTDIDERVDIYGAGAVFYELLTGRPPFAAPDAPNANLAVLAMVVTSEPRPPREIQPDIAPALDAVVLRAMRRNRDERYSSVDVFAQAIREALEHPNEVPWVPPKAAGPQSADSRRAVLPSLASDSLQGTPAGGSLMPQANLGVQVGQRPQQPRNQGTGELPPIPAFAQGHSPGQDDPQPEVHYTTRIPIKGEAPARHPRIKILVAALYLVFVGAIALSLVLDRLGTRKDTEPQQAVKQAPSKDPQKGQDPPSLGAAGKQEPEPPPANTNVVAGPSPCPEEMVAIPPGCFLMGSTDPAADEDERPPHQVCLTHGFCIDRHEVENVDFRACVKAGRCRMPSRDFHNLPAENFTKDDQPMVLIPWRDADQYCRAMGKRLPTEAEWEYSARGTEGRLYPWGQDEPTCETAVVGAYALPCAENEGWCRAASKCLGKNPSHPLPKGSRPLDRSPFGVMDMGGNVSEWVADWYGNRYYETSPRYDPKGPQEGLERVYRGGSWGQMGTFVRATFRNRMDPRAGGDIGLGFRCAK